jgi:hypothetical protein
MAFLRRWRASSPHCPARLLHPGGGPMIAPRDCRRQFSIRLTDGGQKTLEAIHIHNTSRDIQATRGAHRGVTSTTERVK